MIANHAYDRLRSGWQRGCFSTCSQIGSRRCSNWGDYFLTRRRQDDTLQDKRGGEKKGYCRGKGREGDKTREEERNDERGERRVDGGAEKREEG